MAKLILIPLVLLVCGVVWFSNKVLTPESPPKLNVEEWWGPKELKGKEDTRIRPFQVNFSAELIQDLKQRLKAHRQPAPPLADVGFRYGFNSNALTSWVQYWADQYPFEERQKFLNKYPQYKTNIQGLDIHFVWVKPDVPKGTKIVPLLLMHGWPGSVREFYEAIPLLMKQENGHDFVFEVIVPSLPGYGFSDGAVRPGMGPAQISVVLRNLMRRLGYKQFYIQGGDWGAVVAGCMATLFPKDVLGYHSNMLRVSNTQANLLTVMGAYFPSLIVDSSLADRMYPLTKYFAFLMEEFGYFHLQATKPDTIGIALTDSPTGLLAYILEKFSSWTNWDNRELQNGGFKGFTKEQLIDNLMIYWSSNSITTSMRLYAESMTSSNRELELDRFVSEVPTWALQAKNELFYQPPNLLRTKYSNFLGNTVLENGGHFIAFEKPEIFVKDVFKAVKEFRLWHNRKTEL